MSASAFCLGHQLVIRHIKLQVLRDGLGIHKYYVVKIGYAVLRNLSGMI